MQNFVPVLLKYAAGSVTFVPAVIMIAGSGQKVKSVFVKGGCDVFRSISEFTEEL
jgi:hypothetical protein